MLTVNEPVSFWVKRPQETGGLDHLGVQAPCINLYGQLLPGITNVTDRARYYSLYPWFIWRLSKRPEIDTVDDYFQALRKADCLFSMIGRWHALSLAKQDTNDEFNRHALGLIGTNTLRKPVESLGESVDTLRLSRFATRDDVPDRYFQNPLGGLGQYYLGTLQDLAILDRKGQIVRCTKQKGAAIAEAVDRAVPGDAFFQTLERDRVTAADLAALRNFCPCYLQESPQEQEELLDLFFARSQRYSEDGQQRRLSLGLILNLATQLQKTGGSIDAELFRSCAYSGSLPGGQSWVVPNVLSKTRQTWATYQRNELLSVLAQSVFAFTLRSLRADPGLRLESAGAVADWLLSQSTTKTALGDLAQIRFPAIVEKARRSLPDIRDWEDPEHELQLGRHLTNRSPTDQGQPDSQELQDAFRLLVSLVARSPERPEPYSGFAFSGSYFREYPINLIALRHMAETEWTDMTGADLVRWLVSHWGIQAHLRVALRKLRYQSQSTFQIQPTDDGLVVVGVPTPVYTNPRFHQANQVLRDLGALAKQAESWGATALGEELLEDILAS